MFGRVRQSVRWRRDGEAASDQLFLSQRRVYILPTKPGLLFGAMLVALFIGAVNYNLSLGLGFTFLLASCALIDMHLTFRNLAHLTLKTGRAEPVFAGEEARFELQLANPGPRDRYAIWVDFIGSGAPGIAQPVDVPPAAVQTVLLSVPAAQRGWLKAPRVRLQTRFPLGLLRAWSYWLPEALVLVYPHPEDDAPPLPRSGADDDGGELAGNDDFAGIRGYQAGDSLKRLAWRQIARVDSELGGHLVTKHFEGGGAADVVLDFSELPSYLDTELKLSRMTRWVIEAEVRGVPYAFRLGAIRYDCAVGPAHREACLRALALYLKA